MNPYAHFLADLEPLKVISATPARIRTLVKGLTPAQLKKRVRRDKWSMHEILLHLADCELVYASRCRLAAFEDQPFLQPFDQDRWNMAKLREKDSTADTIVRFEALRKSQIGLYKATPKGEFGRTGNHPERGQVSLRTMFETCAGHDLNHLAQLEAMRGELKKRKK